MKGEELNINPKFDNISITETNTSSVVNVKNNSEDLPFNYEIPIVPDNIFFKDFLEDMLEARPFNMDWDINLIEKFLVDCGYSIAEKTDNEDRCGYRVAFKDPKEIKDADCCNYSEVFQKEVQQILLRWLLRIR